MVDEGDEQTQVEIFILDLLAADLGRDREELHAELVAASPDMAYDSIMLVELMTRVSQRYGVSFSATYSTARDMRSIRSFAARVCDERRARDADTAAP